MQLDHRPVEAERPFVREAFRDDLILGSQPAIEVREVGIGDDKVHIGMQPRRLQPEEFAAPPTDQRNLEARSLDQSESAYRPVATVVHTPIVGQRCRADLPIGSLDSPPLDRAIMRSMSSAHSPANEQIVLTPREAFLVMTDYIWRYAQSAGDDLITLLGDTTLEADGQPTDPAAWTDWLKSVERVSRGLQPRSDD